MLRHFGKRLATTEEGGSQPRGGSSGLPPLPPVDHSQQQSSDEEIETGCSNTSGGGHPIFAVHFTKERDTLIDEKGRRYFFAICNYCHKAYKVFPHHSYKTLTRHMANFHTEEFGVQTKQLNTDAMARFISTEHISFNFDQRVGLVDYMNETVNPEFEFVLRSSIT